MSDQAGGLSPKRVKILVFGILSLVFMCVPIFNIIWSIISLKGAGAEFQAFPNDKMVKIGKTLSLIGIITGILGIIYWIVYIIIFAVAGANAMRF